MDTASSKHSSSLQSSPFSSPKVSALLKIRILSWSQETGLPISVRVQVADRTFSLHKYPLFSKSRYLNRKLKDSNEVELPKDFPGGPETFEMIALFIYGSSTLVNTFNVAALRCAAEFLELREEPNSRNLCERFDIYLNQVVLQNWNDTLIVLRKCQSLLPWAEDLLIVSRCIESLAFMACMEILDPERMRDQPVVTLEALVSQAWSLQIVKEIDCPDIWIKDLIDLPFGFFQRVINSLRRQGMKEKYVSPIILFYANNWVLSTKTCNLWENSGDINDQGLAILQSVVNLLPNGEKDSKVIPVGFYFSLLSKSLKLGLATTVTAKLKDLIVSLLNTAFVEDFLFPRNETGSFSSSTELTTMESIFTTYMSCNVSPNHSPLSSRSVVAELWDMYLNYIATDPRMSSKRFMDLIEIVPMSRRQNHDQLYRALNTFLHVHLDLLQEERETICKDLKCQKMSQEICVEVVQNDMMPLRLIVQALFVQQLSTHQTLRECSDSFRYTVSDKFSGSLSKSQNLGESPYINGEEAYSRPLGFLLQRDYALEMSEASMSDYKLTTSRIQNLEQEVVTLKGNLIHHKISKEMVRTNSEDPKSLKPCSLEAGILSKKRNPVGQATNCIGSLNFISQRKYVSRLLKVFRRLRLLGSRKSKRKPGAPTLRTK